MKKITFALCVGILLSLSSCTSFYKSGIPVTAVSTPMIETTTVADLNVRTEKIVYTYYPTKTEARHLSKEDLLRNAIFKALKQNGDYDALVELNYRIKTKGTLFGTRVTEITVSGYPATFENFRKPTKEDRENMEVGKPRTMKSPLNLWWNMMLQKRCPINSFHIMGHPFLWRNFWHGYQ